MVCKHDHIHSHTQLQKCLEFDPTGRVQYIVHSCMLLIYAFSLRPHHEQQHSILCNLCEANHTFLFLDVGMFASKHRLSTPGSLIAQMHVSIRLTMPINYMPLMQDAIHFGNSTQQFSIWTVQRQTYVSAHMSVRMVRSSGCSSSLEALMSHSKSPRITLHSSRRNVKDSMTFTSLSSPVIWFQPMYLLGRPDSLCRLFLKLYRIDVSNKALI